MVEKLSKEQSRIVEKGYTPECDCEGCMAVRALLVRQPLQVIR
jgi:hypothetical protein